MTPKEEANELVDRFKEITPCSFYELDEEEMHIEKLVLSKQCALICVDDIIDSHYRVFTGVKGSVYDYWKEVKQQINKL